MPSGRRLFPVALVVMLALGGTIRAASAQVPAGAESRSELLAPDPALPQIPLYVRSPRDSALRPAVSAMRESEWADAIDLLSEALERDPDHLEARYYRGIAYRERAKLRTILSRMFDNWEKGIDAFRRVIARDSTYRDVLYQLALYSRVQSRLTDLRGLDENVEYREAIRHQHAQVRLRPDRPRHLFHLYEFYRRYLRHTDPDKALPWLRDHPSEFSTLAQAEALRRSGRLDAADRTVNRLLADSLETLPVQPVLLTRARILYARDRPLDAQKMVRRAIDRIERPIEAAFVFDDFKYVITPEELAGYRAAEDAGAYQSFLRSVWARRDPMPARALNLRLRAHYERLLVAEREYVFDGFRLWRNNPDRLNRLSFPAPYYLNHEYNDKGLVYIRHGEPDDRVVTLEGAGSLDNFRGYLGSQQSVPGGKQLSPLANWRPNESWRYTYRPMEFHFVIAEGGTGNNWRLTPTVTNLSLLRDREHWGGVYVRMTRAAEEALERLDEGGDVPSPSVMSFSQDRGDLADRSVESVRTGFRTDRHTWPDELTTIEFPMLAVPFRKSADSSEVVAVYGLDGASILGDRIENAPVSVESGFALHDPSWNEVASLVRRVPVGADSRRVVYRRSVPPDSYRVSTHVRTLDDERQGGYQTSLEVPDFDRGSTAMSGLLPAHRITREGEGDLERRGHRIRVNPSASFAIGRPVYVYFELYHLGLDPEDRTRYRVTYRLVEEEDDPGFFGRIFGGSDPQTITLETRRRGTEPTTAEYAELDVREASPGTYRLTVRVEDEVADRVLERSRTVTLTEP